MARGNRAYFIQCRRAHYFFRFFFNFFIAHFSKIMINVERTIKVNIVIKIKIMMKMAMRTVNLVDYENVTNKEDDDEVQ